MNFRICSTKCINIKVNIGIHFFYWIPLKNLNEKYITVLVYKPLKDKAITYFHDVLLILFPKRFEISMTKYIMGYTFFLLK